MKIAYVIDANKEKAGMIESIDNGKPIRETMAIDVPYSSDHFRILPMLSGLRGKCFNA